MCVLVCLILCTGFTGSQKNALSLELEFQAVARHLKLGYLNEPSLSQPQSTDFFEWDIMF